MDDAVELLDIESIRGVMSAATVTCYKPRHFWLPGV
jgi:hypothetical protein